MAESASKLKWTSGQLLQAKVDVDMLNIDANDAVLEGVALAAQDLSHLVPLSMLFVCPCARHLSLVVPVECPGGTYSGNPTGQGRKSKSPDLSVDLAG